jgi:DNA-directed RNA polymerase beta subunit
LSFLQRRFEPPALQVCHLSKKKPGSDLLPSPKELAAMSECIYDQGGYFVVNGSEKVLIAQERRANNMVRFPHSISTASV